ncbi:MAG: DNA-processing protein DprA [Alphaproteobacteria bacterium]|nr:DNA-processing protein DprA [Alphaproteobacteria bacterium]
MSESWLDALRLHLTPGLGLRRSRALLQHFPGCDQVLQAPDGLLRDALGLRLWSALRAAPLDWAAQVDRVRHWLGSAPAGHAHRVVAWGDPAYPAALTELPDPPLLLFMAGSQDHLPPPWPAAVALVGSRGATPQGLSLARQWSGALVDAGWCVVSGLAHGIDAAAHDGALSASNMGCVTLAVMGTGPDRVYPVVHAELKARILMRGCCLTEFLPGTPARPAHFPMRNRLISALSDGLVVVEAGIGSGSLISAQCALEQGKEVMAVPGSVRSPLSRGCHALLRQGAYLVQDVADVLSALPDVGVRRMNRSRPSLSLTTSSFEFECTDATEVELRLALGHDPVPIDELLQRMGGEIGPLRSLLQGLELEGRVARLAGDRVQWMGP